MPTHVCIAAYSNLALGAPQRRLDRSKNGSSRSRSSPAAAALSSAASVAARAAVGWYSPPSAAARRPPSQRSLASSSRYAPHAATSPRAASSPPTSATQSAPSASASSSRTTPSVDRPWAASAAVCKPPRRRISSSAWLAFGALSCLRLVASLTSATIAEGARPCRSASLRNCLKASSLAVRVPRPICQLSRATPEGRNDSLTSSQRCVT